METLQMAQLKIIPFIQNNQQVHRIVDEEETLVAKVNGAQNLAICQKMVQAFNDRENIDRMKSLLRFRLIDILHGLSGSSIWNFAIVKVLKDEEGANFDAFLVELKQAIEDGPNTMTRILGGEAVQILQLL